MSASALVWLGGSDFELRAIDLPQPGDGELLVRVDTATVCGSDRHSVTGRRPAAFPSILGHEGVGHIEATGSDAVLVDGSPARGGDRVVWSVTAPCMQCDRCIQGRTAKCRAVLKTGHEPIDGPWPLSGTYSTHILLRQHQPVVQVPPEVADGSAAAAGCALATVMAAVEAAGTLNGRSVLISGVGMLGLMAAAVALTQGAALVEVSDPDPRRVALAAELGAEESLSDAPMDVVFDFSGNIGAVGDCFERLDIGGVLVLVGSVSPGPVVPIDPERLVRGWHTITGVHNYEPRHLQEAVDFLTTYGRMIDWDQVLSESVRLDEVPDLFNRRPTALREVVSI